MNIHEVMQCYQQIIDYLKVPALEYFMAEKYNVKNRKDMLSLFYAFMDMCDFSELFMAMMNKKAPLQIIQQQIENHREIWEESIKQYLA